MPKSRGRLGERAAIAICLAAWLLQWVRIRRASGEPAWSGIFPPLVLALLVIFRPPAVSTGPAPRWVPAAGAAALLAVLAIWPWLEPFPGWPLAEWLFSGALFGLVWALAAGASGTGAAAGWLRPMCFGLAALPWPAVITAGLMGKLRAWTAAALAEGFTWAGRPALAEGTVLRVGRGTIGLEEACGGIRSMQTAVLLAFAIGALRRDDAKRQAKLLVAGVGLALAANLLRLAGLAWICGIGGNAAVERWHDRMAVGEFGIVLLGFAALALRTPQGAAELGSALSRTMPSAPGGRAPPPPGGSAALTAGVLLLLPLGAAAVHEWFDRPGHGPAAAFDWTIRLPTDLASDSSPTWTPAMQAALRCDEHQIGAWRDRDGRRREGYAIEWRNNPNAANALAAHNPDICLPLAGNTPIGTRPPVAIDWNGHRWFFSVKAFSGRMGRFELYYLTARPNDAPWGDPPGSESGAVSLDWSFRWREVLAGRRGISARAVAVAIFGAAGPDEADRQFRLEFSRLVRSLARPAPSG